MKYFYSLTLVFVFLISTLGQDSSKVENYDLKHGIQFQIRSLSLRNFDNYTLAYRYLLDKNTGFRLAILTDLSNEDNKGTQIIDSLEYSTPNEYNVYDFQLSFQYLKTILRDNDFSLFIGGGPLLSLEKRLQQSISNTSEYKRERKDMTKTFGYGFNLLFGVEYALSKNVVLSGEYGFTLLIESGDSERIENYYYYEDRPDRIYENTNEIDKFSLKGIGVNLGISVFL